MNPEPGTDGKPAPLPNGHSESIIVSNGVAYVGSDNGMLYALDTTGGTVRWSYKIGAAVWLYSVSGGLVYAAGDTALYALNAHSGKLLWRYQGSKWISQAIVVAGTVYTATSAENNASIIVALRAADGGKLWTYSVSAATPALMGVVDGIVYVVASSDGPDGLSVRNISALRASDGRILWSTAPGSDAGLANGGIVVANGIVYFATSQGDIYALRTDTGAIVWHADQPSTPGLSPNAPTPTLANGLLYVASPLGLFAYNASDGNLVWQHKAPFPGGPIVVQPIVVNGVVYSGGQRETILALRASDGKLLWQYGTGGVANALAVIDGMVINYSGPVEALRASDGKLLWQQNVNISGEGSDAAGPETVGDGVVVVGGDDGVVQAIRVSDGKLLWHYAIRELPVQSPPVYSAFIFFASSMPYQQALAIVTNLGLKTFADCQFGAWVSSDNKTFFGNDHEMTVLATVNSAPLWFERLKATGGIQMVQPDGPHSCPLMRPGNGPAFLPASQANIYVQVTFASTTRYTPALDAVNALGFRLADPCYEQSRAQGHKPAWQSQDQSNTFNQSHTLILATTGTNAVTWQKQLGSVKGVVKVVTPFKAGC
jgi:outer membrane protein assembly factor BamB